MRIIVDEDTGLALILERRTPLFIAVRCRTTIPTRSRVAASRDDDRHGARTVHPVGSAHW